MSRSADVSMTLAFPMTAMSAITAMTRDFSYVPMFRSPAIIFLHPPRSLHGPPLPYSRDLPAGAGLLRRLRPDRHTNSAPAQAAPVSHVEGRLAHCHAVSGRLHSRGRQEHVSLACGS